MILGANKTRKRVEITTSGTWTVPAGVEVVNVTCVGGGGGGAAGNGSNGGGGGGGGSIVYKVVSVTPGDSITITIGAGGSGGVYGGAVPTAGGSTSFGSLVTALGGEPANNGANGSSGGYGGGPAARSPYDNVSGRSTDPRQGYYIKFGFGGYRGQSNVDYTHSTGFRCAESGTPSFYVIGGGGGGAGYNATGPVSAGSGGLSLSPGGYYGAYNSDAGGGGGGSYGVGGKGGAGASGAGAAGTQGGGGGGGGSQASGGAGGDGLVIIEYEDYES